MSIQPITTITSNTVVLSAQNIDTDQIIPARFLTTTGREGLGEHLFHDWRTDKDGSPTDHILNTDKAKDSQILVAGENFGCGSSREHAPWALHDYGFRAVISSKIADIFHANALKNGVLPLVIAKYAHEWLLNHSGVEISIDLETCELRLPGNGGVHNFSIDPFSKQCLLAGKDELDYLESQAQCIRDFESRLEA